MPELKITSSDADAVKALAKLQGQINKLQAALAETTAKAKAAGGGMAAAMEQTGAAAGKTGQAIKGVGEEGGKAFGARSLASLKNYAAGIVSIATGFAVARDMLRQMREEGERAKAGLRGGAAAQAELAQLAGGDPAEMRRMMAEVRKTRSETGASTSEAARLQFALTSAGIPEMRAFFAGFRGIVEDPAALAEQAVTLQTAFGKEEAGGIPQIVSKLYAGSKATKTDIGGLAAGLTQFAQPARAIAATDEEAIASLAVLTNAAKSPEVAATQLKALSTAIGRRGVGGGGILAGVLGMQQLIEQRMAELPAGAVAEEEIQKLFGSDEALSAFRAIVSNRPAIEQVTRQVRAEDRPALAWQIRGMIEQIPELNAVRRADVAKEFALIREEEQRGVQALQLEEFGHLRRARDVGQAPATRWVRNKWQGMAEALEWQGMAELPGKVQRGLRAADDWAAGVLGTGGNDVVAAVQENTAAVKEQTRLIQRDRNPTLGRPDEDR